MTLYLDCYNTAEDLLRAAQTQLSNNDYSTLANALEFCEYSKDEMAEELEHFGVYIESRYPSFTDNT